MKKILAILVFSCFCIGLQAGRKDVKSAAKRLASTLTEHQKREDITPDSFFYDWHQLTSEMLAQQDSTAKNIYRAAMARVLCLNTWRSQSYRRDSESHPDSIQEWTQQEYMSHAAALYAQSLSDLEALHSCRLKDVAPLVESGKDDAIFQGDLLYLVWKTAHEDLTTELLQAHQVPDFGDIISLYRRHGLREATLRLRLDSLERAGDNEDDLLRLRDEYADLPACAEVYLRLASLYGKKNQERHDLLAEALKRYPKSRQANALRNRIASLRQPRLSTRLNETLYPGKDYDIPFQIQNMKSGSMVVYRIPLDFSFSDEEEEGTQTQQVRRAGTLVETLQIPMDSVVELETKHDTITWHTPSFGRYAIILEGTTQEKLAREPQPHLQLIRVSSLAFMYANMPDGTKRVMVTDAMSGQPQQGVSACFYHNEDGKYVKIGEATSNERGIAELQTGVKDYIYVELTRGDDTALGMQGLGWRLVQKFEDKEEDHLSLYTDRSIYRPGQIVYVGGIAYSRSHDRSPQAEAGKELSLVLLDANGKKVLGHDLKTDDYGTISDSLQLPESGLPGLYTIRVGNYSRSFRVEEYRRPTFTVEFDKMPPLTLPADSVTLTGRAMTYSQWPVSNARVTGTYKWRRSWWWSLGGDRPEPHNIDTLYTDDEGRFAVRIPLSLTKSELASGRMLSLSVDVLSAEGETQHGSTGFSVCSKPLRMWEHVPSQECKERLEPWRFNLYASNDKAVEGDVVCCLTDNDGKQVAEFTVPSGRDTIPDALRTLPSGSYRLFAKAEVNGDADSCKTSFTLFSIADKHLQGKHDLWLYAPEKTMSAASPARFQVGTTLPEAWIYCLVTGECGVVRDTILHLLNEATLVEVPYEDRFSHQLSVKVLLMHDGGGRYETTSFQLQEPDTRLRMRWDTFRDHLQPGQKEQWRLTLTRPDGSPADANVMLGMYDKSLDALYSYSMNLWVSRSCYRNVGIYSSSLEDYQTRRYCELGLPLYFYSAKGYSFASWNEALFQGIGLTRSGKVMRLRGVDGASVRALAKEMTDKVVLREVAVNNTVATADALEEASDAEADEATEDVPLRSDLSELAFFRPQLRTNSKGQTSIEFSLPEGLTSWHLHGVAHTKDMMTTHWEETIVAQKELMAELTLPRFLRNGDEASLTASIRNASETRQAGQATLSVVDAETEKVIKQMKFAFDIEPGKESVFHMPYRASAEHPVLAVKWSAKGGSGSDGEQRYLPVLSDMQNVTETKTYLLRGDTTLMLNLENLFANGNAKAANKTLTIEHVANPLYLALQALPSLTAPTRSDVLSVASAYYAGSVAYFISHKHPDVRKAFEAWAKAEGSADLQSPLEKNQQLADILVNESPWVAEAEQQKASRQRLASLFAEMEQEQRRMTMLSALAERQNKDGSFGWFPGMSGSTWMTSEVAMLLVRLGDITGHWSTPEIQIIDRAMSFLESKMHYAVTSMRKEKDPELSFSQLRYLYIYIMYRERPNDDAKFLLSLLKKQSENYDREERALAAIVLKRAGEEKKAKALMPRIHELLNHADGQYIAYPSGTFVSIDRKVESHANFMEAVSTVEPKETALLSGMAEWLIQQKRTQEWEQPIQSADAIYALMQSQGQGAGSQTQARSSWSGMVTYDNNQRRSLKSEGESSSIRERIEVKKQARQLTIAQHAGGSSPRGGDSAGHLSWGAVYAQYQLPAAEVTQTREGMAIRREVENIQGLPVSGKTEVRTGDRVHVRYTITADRDYEYVSLRAPRIAAAEPVRQLSGYRWTNGIDFYCAIHDASTEYFFDRLPRGTYVVEEDWLLNRDGMFLLPPARLGCLYAPEYQSHTAGETLQVQ